MNDEVSELLKKAEQGDADAELRLGSAYCSGDGVEKSSSEAEKWWQRAAAHGSAGAARCLESLHQTSHKSGESGAQNEDSEKAVCIRNFLPRFTGSCLSGYRCAKGSLGR